MWIFDKKCMAYIAKNSLGKIKNLIYFMDDQNDTKKQNS